MVSLIVRSKTLAILAAALLLVASCTSSGDAAESGPTTTLGPQSRAASATIADGTIGPQTTVGTGSSPDADGGLSTGSNGDDSDEGDSVSSDSVGADVARTDIEPEGFDDGTVLVDTDGLFDDTDISAVILACAAGEQGACGNLGGRLAGSDAMSESDRSAAICTAGPLLVEEGQSLLAGIITLSLLLADSGPSIYGPIETIRLSLPGDPQLDSAISAASTNAELSC